MSKLTADTNQSAPKETADSLGHEFIFSENTKIRWFRLSEAKQLPEREEIIPGFLIANTLEFLYGPAGSSKTMLLLTEACCLASGHDFLGMKIPEIHKCIYASLELSVKDLADRADEIMHDWSDEEKQRCDENLILFDSAMTRNLIAANPESVQAVGALCHEMGADIFVIDSFIDWIAGFNIRDEQQMSLEITRLMNFSAREHITIQAIHHATKQFGDSAAFENMAGIHILIDLADGVWLIKPEKDCDVITITNDIKVTKASNVKCRYGAPKTFRAAVRTDYKTFLDFIPVEDNQIIRSSDIDVENSIIEQLKKAGVSGLNAGELKAACKRRETNFTAIRNRMFQSGRIAMVERTTERNHTETRYYVPEFAPMGQQGNNGATMGQTAPLDLMGQQGRRQY